MEDKGANGVGFIFSFFLEMAYFDALLMVFLEVIDISTWALGYGIRMIR